MNSELLTYKNCLADKACHPKEINRISFNPNIQDPDLIFDEVNNPFKIDQNKILICKSSRRLPDKTQVFFTPENPHIRNRQSHTNEVTAIAKTISQFLGLNTELVEAIALGHDLGHGPGGHLFEQASEDLGIDFRHERFSGIIVTSIEKKGNGLNLTKETVDGILKHSRGEGGLDTNQKAVNENSVVMYADKIAYLFSDINDLQRFDWIESPDLKTINSLFPGTQTDRVNKCIIELVKESGQKGYVSFSDCQTAKDFKKIKDLLYVYYKKLNRQSVFETIKTVYNNVDKIGQFQKYDPTLILAPLTDSELSKLGSISLNGRIVFDDFQQFGVFEFIENGTLEGKTYKDLDIRLQQKLY